MTPPTNKGQKKSGSRKGNRGGAGSSEQNVSAGRGRHIPRANLGKDTLLGLAQSQKRTLSYTYKATLASGVAGAYNEATTVSLNNVFQPNGVSSPAGYAKYMTFYSKAYVFGARLTLHTVRTVAAGTIEGITITTNNTSLGAFDAAINNGMCDWAVVGANPDSTKLVQKVDIARFLNKPRILDDPQLFCTAAAGPTQLVVAHIWTQGTSAVATSFDFVAELEIDVCFTDPIPFT
jgi:hypothetical protein